MLEQASKMLRHKREMDSINTYNEFLEYIKSNFGEFEGEKTINFPSEDSSILIKIDEHKNLIVRYSGQGIFASRTFFNDEYFNSMINDGKLNDGNALEKIIKDDIKAKLEKEDFINKIIRKLKEKIQR